MPLNAIWKMYFCRIIADQYRSNTIFLDFKVMIMQLEVRSPDKHLVLHVRFQCSNAMQTACNITHCFGCMLYCPHLI